MPPLTCPSPEPPDCGLYQQRAVSPDEKLRRLIVNERGRHTGLADLIRAEAVQANPAIQANPRAPQPQPTRPALPPAPEPVLLPINDRSKGRTR
jgi:hypothetical protein